MISLFRYIQTKRLLVEQLKTLELCESFGDSAHQMAQCEMTLREMEYHRSRIKWDIGLLLTCALIGVILYGIIYWRI